MEGRKGGKGGGERSERDGGKKRVEEEIVRGEGKGGRKGGVKWDGEEVRRGEQV